MPFAHPARAIATGGPLRRLSAAIVLAAALLALAPARAALADTLVVVGAGDTLSRIAADHGTTVAAIVERNGLPSADLVYSGQRLLVPGDEGASDQGGEVLGAPSPDEASGAAPQAPDAADGGAATIDDAIHVVAPGESLFSIAMAYGTTVRALARANGIGRAAFVHVGQRLLVAGATRDGSAGLGGGVKPAAARTATAQAGEAAADAADRAAGGDGAASGEGRRIVVDLSDQTLSAYDGARLANRFIVSSGSPWTPTPLGTYAVYLRLSSQRMVGPGYDLPGVPFVQYFTGSYAIHGAYWHQSFGIPVSHGCVNLQPGDAAWLWEWSAIGTPVIVQP